LHLSRDTERAEIERAFEIAIANHPDRRAEIEALRPRARVYIKQSQLGGPPEVSVRIGTQTLDAAIARTPDAAHLRRRAGIDPKPGQTGYRQHEPREAKGS